MFVGACAGSTGGGIKVSRILILCKAAKKEFQLYLHPNAVKKIKMDDKVITHDILRSTNIYISLYLMIFAASVLLIAIDNFDLITNFMAVTATLNNIGPGLRSLVRWEISVLFPICPNVSLSLICLQDSGDLPASPALLQRNLEKF